jgi:hypothetical protein
MKHNSNKISSVPGRNLQASSEAGKFGVCRANFKFVLATCKKTKYTGMFPAILFEQSFEVEQSYVLNFFAIVLLFLTGLNWEIAIAKAHDRF